MERGGPQGFFYRRRLYASRARRIVDILGATILLGFAAPIIAAAMLAILAEDGGPVLFKQQRAGRFGRLFTLLKLRSMHTALCNDELSPASALDPRITRVGRVLRKLSVDELPQLINVIRGDMSLVGPRPEMPFLVHGYENWQHLRHLVRPGLTCFWQISLRSTIPLHRPEATSMDIDYIRRASPQVDATILMKTFLALVAPKGVY